MLKNGTVFSNVPACQIANLNPGTNTEIVLRILHAVVQGDPVRLERVFKFIGEVGNP